MASTMPALLSPAHIALVDSGISAIVASRDAQLRPSLMRAVGTHISADGQQVSVFLRPSQAGQLLADLAAGGPIAVVFSDPPSNNTLQLKAAGARMRAARPATRRCCGATWWPCSIAWARWATAPPTLPPCWPRRRRIWWPWSSRPSRPSTRHQARVQAQH